MNNEELTLNEKELDSYAEALDEAEEAWEKDRPIRKRGRKKKDENNTL